MTTVTPYRPAVQPGRDGFTQMLRAEWTKFRTVRGWLTGMAVAALVMVALGLFAAGNSDIACQSPGGQTRTGRACLPPPPPIGPGGEAVTDSFYFVHQPLAGDGSITARITSFTGRYGNGSSSNGQLTSRGLQPWSKAGIIVKASTRPGSPYAAVLLTGRHGVRMQYDYTQDVAGLPGGTRAVWLRLTRSGDTITGYDSADGSHWTQIAAVHLAGLPPTVQAGLFATSPLYTTTTLSFGGASGKIGPSQATAVFDQVKLSAAGSGRAWAGTQVGPSEAPVPGGYRRSGERFTLTGSGDIAPLLAGDGNAWGPPTVTIDRHLVGAFAALIVLAVVAAMFITAEYRRGLIRTTLAASPRRGRVLAAKALVIGLVTFVTGLAAAIVAVVVGQWLARNQVAYLLPVTWLTKVRVVAGTAALLAVAAVFALALGVIVRRSAVAVTAVIVAIVLPYVLSVASVLPLGAADWLLRLTPAAGFAIQQSIPRYPQVSYLYRAKDGYYPLPPWAGFAVLCGYAALALALAALALRRRDA